MGLRFRVDRKRLPNQRFRPDIVFGPSRVAAFVDGCFWHGCPKHDTLPKVTRDWCSAKLAAIKERDRRTDEALRIRGWLALRFWEHESPDEFARAIGDAVLARRT